MEPKDLKPYFDGQKRHAGYKKSVELYEELVVHAEGRYPTDAIEKRRPSESEKIQEYRKEIFVPIPKETVSQILTAYGKIRRSPDWVISFPENDIPIAKGESLEDYMTKNYPLHNSVEFWAFSTLLKTYLLDAGAVVLTIPLDETIKENEYLKPIPVIYNSPDVLEYDVHSGLIILKERAHDTELENNFYGTYTVVDTQKISRYQNTTEGPKLLGEYMHDLGFLPAFKVPGRFFKSYKHYTLNESPIQVIAARLKEFVREYSDLQAEVVQHIHSETWQWATLSCKVCDSGGTSTGKIIDKKTGKHKVCSNCNGTGSIANSPYTNIVVRGSKKNQQEQDAPIPPKGYITKPVDIVTIQDERCEKHIYKCLEALNMQFLMKTPANQSGYAKDVDAQELQNNVYAIAEDIVWCLDQLFYITCEYRYRITVKEADRRKTLLPEIPVPEKYDLLSTVYLLDDITKANAAKLNPAVINMMQIELVKKKFYYAPKERDFLVTVLTLDPMPGLTEDEKMIRVENGGVKEENYIISCNIYLYVRMAIEADKQFLSKSSSEQMKVLVKYAQEAVKSMGKQVKEEMGGAV